MLQKNKENHKLVLKEKRSLSQKNVVIERFEPKPQEGLTSLQVAGRIKFQLENNIKQKSSKSVFRILFDNIFTFFNLIWLGILAALLIVESYDNLYFMVVIILNTMIAIIQEIKAKIIVERLKLITTPKVLAIRDGKEINLFANKLVLDDIVVLSIGNQVPSDCLLLEGAVEVNESLLTGESKPVKKNVGDRLLAGSFLTSGKCNARVDRIGKDNYIQSIASQAKKFKSPNSNLFRDLKTIIRYIGIMIIPFALLMFVNNYILNDEITIESAVVQTCASLIGMVPAGMFLLITVALSIGVIKLSQKKTLVQDIYSIEMLARTDVLCLDKTGTITDGTMEVTDVLNFKETDFDLKIAIGNLLNSQKATNNTSRAMLKYFGKDESLNLISSVEFSSDRKFIAASFENFGTIAIGAPDFLEITLSKDIEKKIKQRTKQGERVLLIAHSKENLNGDKLPKLESVGILVIEEHIREDAIETIKWFKENSVQIKIISGDDPETVGYIAQRVGVEGAEKTISLEGMSLEDVSKIAKDFTVFGRVTPEQKHTLIKSLKNLGHVVAMTGDGVNDTLALKEADCSIAMADGSEVARGLSHLVLLDSKFSSLPSVVREGRKVVNNVQQSSTLFLMKTFFTILLSLITIVTLTPYIFEPKQLLLLEFAVIGVSSFMLAFQPNEEIIKGNFIKEVLKHAIPYALLILANFLAYLIIELYIIFDPITAMTLETLMLTCAGFVCLVRLCYPFTKLRLICVFTALVLILIGFFGTPSIFGISWPSVTPTVTLIWTLSFVITALIAILVPIFKNLIMKRFFQKQNNLKN